MLMGQRKGLLFLAMGLLLAVNLGCGLTQGLGFLNPEPASTPLPDTPAAEQSAAQASAVPSVPDLSTQTEQSSENTTPAQPNPTPASDQPKPAGKLAENQIFILPGAEPPTMDPHLAGDATSAEYVVEIYSGLMAYDNQLNLIPDVAESYKISDDGTVYTFTLRDNAVFQDGKPITAADFKWSLERACDPDTGSTTADAYLGDIVGCRDKLTGKADEITGVQVINDQTLQITIDQAKGFFLGKMTYPTAYVLDRENVQGNSKWYLEPNGSGPFALTEYAPADGLILLTRNENYYRAPKPILEKVAYFINTPISTIVGYEQGLDKVDSSLAGVTYDTVPVFVDDLSRVTDPNNPISRELVSTPSLNVQYIGFNVKQPPFDDVKVRQAFNLALDKRRMVQLVFQGSVPVANGIVPPTMPGYENPDLSDFEFDPRRAQALITESTYGDVSELPDITLYISGEGGGTPKLVEALADSLNQNLGVQINVEQVPWGQFLADLNKPNSPYQMYQLGWIADYPDPQNFLDILFHSKSSQNYGQYSNPDVDKLLNEARGEQDTKKRVALYQQAEQLILEDAAWIPLYFGVENWLVKPYVAGFSLPPIKIPKFQYVSILEE
jgi:oligopeptide transport system substrate-binding protein